MSLLLTIKGVVCDQILHDDHFQSEGCSWILECFRAGIFFHILEYQYLHEVAIDSDLEV